MIRRSSRITLTLTSLAFCLIVGACSTGQSTSTGTSGSASTSSPASSVDSATSGNTLKIVSSLPMTGSALGQNQTIVNGIKQVIDETNSTACNGKVKTQYEGLQAASPAAGTWDPEP